MTRYCILREVQEIKGTGRLSRWHSIICMGTEEISALQKKLYYMYREKVARPDVAHYKFMLFQDVPDYQPQSDKTQKIKIYPHENYGPGHFGLIRMDHARFIKGKVYEIQPPRALKKFRATVKGGSTVYIEASDTEEARYNLMKKGLTPSDIQEQSKEPAQLTLK